MKAVLAFDPPRGWAIWAADGPILCGQLDGDSEDVVDDCIAEAWRASGRGVALHAAVVERPHGDEHDGSTPEARIQVALAAGAMRRACVERSLPVVQMRAVEWRSVLRWQKQPSRDAYKALGHRLAVAAAGAEDWKTYKGDCRLWGTRGGKRLDASDAVCQALAAWIVTFGWTGAAERWKQTGTFTRS